MELAKRILKIAVDAILVLLLIILVMRAAVVGSASRFERSCKAVTLEAAETPGKYDAIIVLGCSVDRAQNPSPMLQYRLDRALELYQAGAASRILVSGDLTEGDYDEVSVMKNYLAARGVPDAQILTDGQGYSTYESIYRAATEYQIHRPIIVTQQYHLYRALYIADTWDMQAAGVKADDSGFSFRKVFRLIREWFACLKDINYCAQKRTF